MLPILLAAYKKYGSAAARCLVDANQVCNIGLLAETTKNGRPTATSSSASSQGAGLVCVGGSQPLGIPIGSATSGSSSTSRCRAAWRRAPSHLVATCA